MMKTNINFLSYLTQFFLERELFHSKVVKKIKTHILCSVTFFFFNCAIYGIMWRNTLESGRPQIKIWCLCIAYLLTMATNTHSEYAILIVILIGIVIQIISPLSFNGLQNVTVVIQIQGAFIQYRLFSLWLKLGVKTVLHHQVSKLQQQKFSSYTSSINAVLKPQLFYWQTRKWLRMQVTHLQFPRSLLIWCMGNQCGNTATSLLQQHIELLSMFYKF